MFERRDHLDALAIGLLLLLCFLWGFAQITIKLAATGISPLMQAGIRSVIAVLCLTAWMFFRRIPAFKKDNTLVPGIGAGLLFALEFGLIYWGLEYTSASRAVIFIYTSPFVVALGVHLLVPKERLGRLQLLGMLLAFCGVIVTFAEGITVLGGRAWMGDLLCFVGAIFWGATTVLIRVTKLVAIEPSRTLFYQLLVSALLLPIFSVLLGESGVTSLTPVVLACLAFQGVIVAFASYLTWFWLIAHYPANRLATYTFLTPLFGVLCGVVFLSEPFTRGVLLGLALVMSGIYMVNLKTAKAE